MAQKFIMPGLSAHERSSHEAPATPKKMLRSPFGRLALLAATASLVLFTIPVAWFPMQTAKLALASFFFLIASVSVLRARSTGALWRLPGAWVAGASALLPLAYAVSLIFSVDSSVGWLGFAFDSDTVAVALLATAAFVLSWSALRTPRATHSFAKVLGGVLILAAVVQAFIVLLGGTFLPALFADASVNVIGKWNDFALLISLLALWASVRVTAPGTRTGAWVAVLVLCAGLLSFANFALAWYFLLAGAILFILLTLSRRGKHVGSLAAPVFLIVLSLAGLMWGAEINRAMVSIAPLASLEVRPSFTSSMEVANTAHPSFFRTLIGSGPNTFREAWLAGRSLEVRESPFWNLDFNVGFSTLATAFATTGVLGVIAWLAVPLALLFGALRLRRSGAVEGEGETLLLIGGTTFFLFAAILLYIPSQSVIVLTYLCAGVTASMLWRARSTDSTEHVSRSPLSLALSVTPIVALVLLLLVTTAVATRRAVSESVTNKGLIALASGRSEEAVNRAAEAVRIEKTGNTLRLSLEAGAARLQEIAREPNSAEAQNRFVTALSPTVEAGRQALAKHPRDYRVYFSMGRLYAFLATLGITGAEASARDALIAAAALNPTSPEIPLFRARFEASQGRGEEADAQLQKALELKPNYTDAILFVVQIQIANRNLGGALVAAQSAIESDPTNAGLHFQLGLLYFAGGDTARAIAPLEQAVQLVPSYANAQYFLGLSYYTQGRSQEAIALFEFLVQNNPENTEIALVLSNMKLGTEPFAGGQAPFGGNPETTESAPIAE